MKDGVMKGRDPSIVTDLCKDSPGDLLTNELFSCQVLPETPLEYTAQASPILLSFLATHSDWCKWTGLLVWGVLGLKTIYITSSI